MKFLNCLHEMCHILSWSSNCCRKTTKGQNTITNYTFMHVLLLAELPSPAALPAPLGRCSSQCENCGLDRWQHFSDLLAIQTWRILHLRALDLGWSHTASVRGLTIRPSPRGFSQATERACPWLESHLHPFGKPCTLVRQSMLLFFLRKWTVCSFKMSKETTWCKALSGVASWGIHFGFRAAMGSSAAKFLSAFQALLM